MLLKNRKGDVLYYIKAFCGKKQVGVVRDAVGSSWFLVRGAWFVVLRSWFTKNFFLPFTVRNFSRNRQFAIVNPQLSIYLFTDPIDRSGYRRPAADPAGSAAFRRETSFSVK